jgi:hypothetical protein
MFTLWGHTGPYCDRVRRRDFLRAGALGGLSLPTLLRLRAGAASAARPPARSVIMICLSGGPPHIDMYDMKPDAPAEVRGPFKPVRTRVPGFDVCELMPRQTAHTDKLALVRTVQWVEPMQHELEEVYSGYPKSAQRPAFPAVVSRLHPAPPHGMPTWVSLDQYANRSCEDPQYTGAAHRPFVYGHEGMKSLELQRGITPERLGERRRLMTALDDLRRDIDGRGEFAAMDAHTARAIDMITSPRARQAFDLSREPLAVRERYGPRDAKYIYGNRAVAETPFPADRFLMARRLVEAGVPVVTLRMGPWDYHGTSSGTGNIFTGLKSLLPLLDQALTALVTDLHDRGLDKEVAVLVWGEFGRTPKVNNVEGRDHWPDAGFALFAGAGVRTGQVVGQTDSHAARPKTRPLGPQNVLATVYHLLGIDPKATLPDFSGRPTPLLDNAVPIDELV